jgi:hypothetical protein
MQYSLQRVLAPLGRNREISQLESLFASRASRKTEADFIRSENYDSW